MATLGNTFFGLADLYKMQDPDGNIADVIGMLNQAHGILTDAIAVECNDGGSHLTTSRSGLPSGTWGKLYQGIPQSKGTTQQVADTTGFFEALSTIDKRLLDISKNPNKVRMNEALGFTETMEQEMATGLFYHDTATDPDKFLGLAPRFGDLGAENGGQIIDAGGVASDNTSIWFVNWGVNTCHLLYPEGTEAGLAREDKGEQRVLDGSNNPYFAMEELWRWHLGLTVRDFRYISRIANIDVSLMNAGSVDLYEFLRKAYWKLQSRRRIAQTDDVEAVTPTIYANREVMEALDALATNAGASDNFVRLKTTEVEGQEVLAYRGIPIRETDAILNTEARVT